MIMLGREARPALNYHVGAGQNALHLTITLGRG